jgi:porphobilinogen deaminase
MGISARVEELRRKEHDAVHLVEEGLDRLKDMRAPNVSKHFFSIINQQSEALANGAVLSVTEQKVRIRKLPI